MIKRIFQCDTVPLTLLALFASLSIYIIANLLGNHDLCLDSPFDRFFPSLAGGYLRNIIIGLLLLLIPLGYRRRVSRASTLDFNERVSLYPIVLVLLTVIPSCNALLFLVASALILMLFTRIIAVKEGESAAPTAFIGGIIIAFCTWISPFFLLLTLFLWIALSTLNTLGWRTIIWSLLGLISPIYFYLTLSYIITGELPSTTIAQLCIVDPIHLGSTLRVWWIIYLAVFIALLVLVSLRSFRASSKGIVTRRKLIRLGFTLLIITATISALVYRFEGASPFMSLMAVPMAVIFQEMYRSGKNLYYSLGFLVWFVLTMVISWS